MFNEATESMELEVKKGKTKKKITLAPEEIYIMQRKETQVPVIKHDALIRISEEVGAKIDKTELEFAQYQNPKSFVFVHRAFGTLADGTVVDEVGEANPNNLDTYIGRVYPALMSNKRAQDRLLIRLLGLTGQIYADVEFSSVKVNDQSENDAKNDHTETKAAPQEETKETPKKEKEETEESSMTVSQAEKVVVDYGKYKSSPITMKEMKESNPKDFEWLLNQYKVTKRSSQKMVRLHEAAKTLAETESA